MSKLEEREARRRSAVAGMLSGTGNPAAEPAVERKKRYCLALKPSLYEGVQKVAYVQRQSVSQVITELLEGYLDENSEKIDEFFRLKGIK